MKMRISKKTARLLSILMVVLAIVSVASSVLASGLSIPTGNTSAAGASNISNITNAIIGIAQVVGVGVAVIMLIVLAIKYISAAPGDKAEIKKHAVVYVVGAIILFAASGILGIIKTLSTNVK